VVVSVPTDQHPGVIQWDIGKAEQGGEFQRTGVLDKPPTLLRAALSTLESENEMTGSKIPDYLEELREKWPRLATRYLRSELLEDLLFKATYGHVKKNMIHTQSDLGQSDNDEREEDDNMEDCRLCNRSQTVKRKPREMLVHHGLIASGNQVIKDASFRDTLNKNLGGKVLCVEMEAAGLMDNFPCIVIRGICDYADSHKNKAWQEHAAAVAAAFAKELLGYVHPSEVDRERTVKNMLSHS
jgi:hypothetical protein